MIKKRVINLYGYYSLDEIADAVGNKGKAFLPEVLVGGMKQKDFRCMQIFMLDFDGAKEDTKSGRYVGVNITLNEVIERARRYGLEVAFAFKSLKMELGEEDVSCTLSVKDTMFLNENEKTWYSTLHESGRHKAAKKYISTLYEERKKNHPEHLAELEEFERIISGTKSCDKSRVVVTTHAMLLNMPTSELDRFDTVIIDEDILHLQILTNQKSVSADAVNWIAQAGIKIYSERASKMLSAKPGYYYKTNWLPQKGIDLESMLQERKSVMCDEDDEDEEYCLGEKDNISDIVTAGSYVLNPDGNYKYFCVGELPRKKYIVLSATADPQIYRDYFRNLQVIEYEYMEAKYKGNLLQFVYYSLSRNNLRDNQSVYSFISDYCGENIAKISFMCEEDYHKKMNKARLHYGNAVGVNVLKGKDLAVIGTPFKHPNAYLLPGVYLYGESVNNDKMRRRNVEFNGFSFLMMAYSQDELRHFQLCSIFSELEQAIGRARLLRCSCNVYLFSNFPCSQAEFVLSDYLDKYKTKDSEDDDKN